MSQPRKPFAYEMVIDEICALPWDSLTTDELVDIAWVYSYFSIQFRENLEIACSLYPDDENLKQLKREETDTDNLSPWPNVAAAGEKMNHDEFMKRLLALCPIENDKRHRLTQAGESYLRRIHALPAEARASSIASVEEDGNKVFQAMLRAPRWDLPALKGFKHFLEKHITFDSDPDKGHGALCKHLKPDDRILPMWTASKELFAGAFPTAFSS